MKKIIVILVLLLIVSICANIYQFRKPPVEVISTETRVEFVDYTDTVPVEVEKVVVKWKTIRVPIDTFYTENYAQKDTIFIRDSVINIPISQTRYEDSTYTAWISGYDARLDSIRLRERITYTTTRTQNKRKFCIGPSVGIGYGLQTRQFDAFVGVTATWDIFR